MCGSFCVKDDIEMIITFLKKCRSFKMILKIKFILKNEFVILLVDIITKGENQSE